jgi:glutamine synthetase adenylyltransferase
MAKTEDKLKQLPEVLRPVVERWLERFTAEHGACELSPETEAALIRVVAVSEFAANTILRDWDTVAPQLVNFSQAPDPKALQRFTEEIATSEADEDEVKSRLRRFRHRYMLRVL